MNNSIAFKVKVGLALSTIFLGIHFCSLTQLVARAEEIKSIEVCSYSQKTEENISSLLKNKKGKMSAALRRRQNGLTSLRGEFKIR